MVKRMEPKTRSVRFEEENLQVEAKEVPSPPQKDHHNDHINSESDDFKREAAAAATATSQIQIPNEEDHDIKEEKMLDRELKKIEERENRPKTNLMSYTKESKSTL